MGLPGCMFVCLVILLLVFCYLNVTIVQDMSPLYRTCHQCTGHVTNVQDMSPMYRTCHQCTGHVTILQDMMPLLSLVNLCAQFTKKRPIFYRTPFYRTCHHSKGHVTILKHSECFSFTRSNTLTETWRTVRYWCKYRSIKTYLCFALGQSWNVVNVF